MMYRKEHQLSVCHGLQKKDSHQLPILTHSLQHLNVTQYLTLPYATLPKGSSEWISQGANFCVINTCLTDSSVFLPYINVNNTKSRPYMREGFNVEPWNLTLSPVIIGIQLDIMHKENTVIALLGPFAHLMN
mmetsp:Transcript_15949/g.18427  ORF Transcript_15949/g.18427 Transcript_15949/m.18427 type:complete len:132 (-) Transcript_15949:414-809(-)